MTSCSTLNKVELSAVTSSPYQHVEFEWNIKNFHSLLAGAKFKKDSFLTTLPFYLRETLFPPGTPKIKMTWILMAESNDNITILLHRQSHTPTEHCVYGKISLSFYRDRTFTEVRKNMKSKKLYKFQEGETGLGCTFNVSYINRYLDVEGSLNLKVEADLFVESDGTTEILPFEGKERRSSEVESFKMRKQIILDQVACLFGDETTSDVVVSVFDKEEIEIGNFFCHSAILKGRSSILQDKLEGSTEKKDERVVLKLEVEDVALEVIEFFFTFLYSGKFKDTRDPDGVDPTWIEMLPQLVYIAHKFKVNDLMGLCDIHLHRAVTRDNALDIIALAKYHGLQTALSNLRKKFQEDNDLLLYSIYL